MRVALLTCQWPGLRMGGIGTYVRNAAAALAAAGHEPHVFTLGNPADLGRTAPPGVSLHGTPDLAERVRDGSLPAELAAAVSAGGEGVYRLALGWLLTAAFHDAHRDGRFDVVEVADVDASGLPLLLDPTRDVPVVTHLHCCTAIANRVNAAADTPGRRLIEAMEAAQIHLSDALCAPTAAAVTSTRDVQPLDRDPTVIPHPIACPPGPFAPPPVDAPIVFVGRLERLKGCGELAASLNRFLRRNPSARFRFIGPDTATGPGGTSMRLHIRRTLTADVAGRVDLTGELPPAAVRAALTDCAFVVQPSLSETFGLAVCEAMAAGRTAIVGAGTGSVELVGDAGVAVDVGSGDELADAIESLHRDRPRLLALSQAAHDRVRRLCDPGRVSGQRVSFYQAAVEQFEQGGPSRISGRMRTLDGDVVAAVLPALSRVTAALAGVRNGGGDSPGHRLRTICRRVGGRGRADVLLYGAGKHTARLLSERHAWERDGHRVVGLIDDHPRFAADPVHLGLPVRSLADTEAAAAAGEVVPPVVLSTDTYQDQFWEQTAGLRRRGVPVVRLYEGA